MLLETASQAYHALQKRYLPLVHKGLRRIEMTMRQLLNYGRVEPLQIRQVDIDAVILDCLELLGHRLQNITVNLDLRLSNPCCIDHEAIKQIVMNIALKATQAMPGGGMLTLSSRKENGSIVLMIKDSGTGIAEALQKKIFDPFFTTKEVGEGTGLGLAVTLSLVQRLGGQIEVISRPGNGSLFTLILPLERSCLRSMQRQHPHPRKPMKRILLAEDDEIMRITVYDQLVRENWQVDVAVNGLMAVALLKQNQYHLVLSDIRMPGTNGLDLLARARRQSPLLDVFMMTAFGSVEDAIACLRHGAADYILKPFEMDDLIIRINRIFEMQAVRASCASLEDRCRQEHQEMIGSSAAIRTVLTLIDQIGPPTRRC